MIFHCVCNGFFVITALIAEVWNFVFAVL